MIKTELNHCWTRVIENFCGIYAIYNTISRKYYLGSSCNFRLRKNGHIRDLKRNKHPNQYLQFAFNKYGINSFIWLLVSKCEKQSLIIEEQHYLDYFKPYNPNIGYNIHNIAGRPPSL